MKSEERVWREAGLRRAVLAGDERAWRAWYDEAFQGLFNYVHWRCGGLRDLTDEIVQETWLTAVRRMRSFDPWHGSFKNWLRGIAANLLRNYWRQPHHANGRLLANHPMAPPLDSAIVQREQAQRIAQALARLPERQEEVLRAKYLDGRSVAEIAEEWGETPKAVESLLTRARQAFREAYQPDE